MATVADLLQDKAKNIIYSIDPDESVLEAITRMAGFGIGAMLVMDGDELLGVFSERDYARKVILHGRSSQTTTVRSVRGDPPITIALDAPVHQCMKIMTDRRVRHLPVVDKGKVVGIVSIGDVVHSLLGEQRKTIEELQNYIKG